MGLFSETHFVCQRKQTFQASILVYSIIVKNYVEQWLFRLPGASKHS